eukprot:2438269-Amphidinium_carterae.1
MWRGMCPGGSLVWLSELYSSSLHASGVRFTSRKGSTQTCFTIATCHRREKLARRGHLGKELCPPDFTCTISKCMGETSKQLPTESRPNRSALFSLQRRLQPSVSRCNCWIV